MDFFGFRIDLRGSGARMFGGLWQPVAACGGRCHPVAADRSGLDPPNIETSDSGRLDLEAWCLDAWMLKD